MSLADRYKKKSDIEHVLGNPDTYMGSVVATEIDAWVMVDGHMQLKTLTLNPGLLNLFYEGVVNCSDHTQRKLASPVTYISAAVSEGVITLENDGDGIDVALHPEHGVYIPELIFAHLRTSTNYDPSEKKIVGGKNGFGVKLVLIWSTEATVETVDATRQLKYTQTFRDNLGVIEPPVIKPCKKKPYTRITFKPDYARFGMPGLTDDMQSILIKRIYDLAGITEKRVKVLLNGEVIPVRSFPQYVALYHPTTVYEAHPRWEFAVAMVEEYGQVSFVNGINTSKGGKHVDYVMAQLVRKVAAYIKEKKKVEVKPSSIRDHVMLFLNCTIENPSFDSQIKDYLNTPAAGFGSTCEVSDKFAEKVAKLGIMDAVVALTHMKETATLKKDDGRKSRSVRGIAKLIDAKHAGTVKSHACTLILCEGDSAKAGVVSGLSKEDRDFFGVYPLRGKLPNVRDKLLANISQNKEVYELKQILGLETSKVYTKEDIKTKLRYGSVLFMTDQDLDGSHIKGLCINLFDVLWKSLVQEKFLGFMNTPIIKAKKGTKQLAFYNDAEYHAWKATNPVGWTIKYYKGLGTSTAEEFKAYFKERKIVLFEETPQSGASIDMVFNRKRADERKQWLSEYVPTSLNTSHPTVTYEDFVNYELRHFSKYDCERSIPNMVDGLKPSQRKILYAAFKKKLTADIKVAQLSGYVSEQSAYHHGEASLNGAIVNMAQTFVGSNNINLLTPSGQFGTRLQGGKDSASERYIYTALSKVTRFLFKEADDAVLTYLEDDGFPIEPTYYVPIIPMVLVNGCKGIGTGFSTDIPSFNPRQITQCLMRKLKGETVDDEFQPYYKGFTGGIEKTDNGRFLTKGVYEVKGSVVHITELPVGTWTDDYKEFLETLVGTTVKDYSENSTDTNVDITVKLAAPLENLEKELKLTSLKCMTNMYLFDHQGRLKKYDSVTAIMDEFAEVRLRLYGVRKAAQVKEMEHTMCRLTNKVKYITAILDDAIDLRKKTQAEIQAMLEREGFARMEESYAYLTKMPMDSLSQENVDELVAQERAWSVKLATLRAKSETDLWYEELEALLPMV